MAVTENDVNHLPDVHVYADDSEFYLLFKPDVRWRSELGRGIEYDGTLCE